MKHSTQNSRAPRNPVDDATSRESDSAGWWGWPVALVAMVATLGLAAPAAAQTSFSAVPSTFPVQGYLTNDQGPVDENVSIELALYTAPADSTDGGQLLYEEIFANAPVDDGVFTLELGSGNSTDEGSFNTISPDLFRENPQVFLEITVEQTTLTPRRRLESAPFAALAEHAEHAATADTAADADAVGGVSAGRVYSSANQPSVQDLRNGGYDGVNGVVIDQSNANVGLKGCASGHVLRTDGGNWKCAPSPSSGTWCTNGMPVGLNSDGTVQCEQIEAVDIGSNEVGATEADTGAITSTIGVCSGDLDYAYGVNNSGLQCRSFAQSDFSRSSGNLELSADSVTNNELAQDAVQASNVAQDTLTDAEIANDAVQHGELASNAVENGNIANDAVADDNIQYGCGSEYLRMQGCGGFAVDTVTSSAFPTCDQVGVGDVCKAQSSQSCVGSATKIGTGQDCTSTTSTGSVQLFLKTKP